jgi:hypothetical protein
MPPLMAAEMPVVVVGVEENEVVKENGRRWSA